MSFASISFVLFGLAMYGAWLLVRRDDRVTLWVLFGGSLFFYGYAAWPLVFLILAYVVIDWMAALLIERSARRRTVLALGVGFNLGVLAFWKYGPWALSMLGASGGGTGVLGPDGWLIPLGISFYSFTGIAYMVDVHRGTTRAEASLWRFGLYLTFFPQLVAGPILRAREFLAQLQPGTLPRRAEAPLEAGLLIARGFFKKVVLADRIALAIDPFFAHAGSPETAGVWSLPYVYLYAAQIYLDFSGYTDIARGIGLLFGFRWPENFDRPYLAGSIREFWSRWHVTLSRFLRDYLYVPLGGSRRGPGRTALNLMLTMMLGGLWHGAGWNFLAWGTLHGGYLVAHRIWARSSPARWLARRTGPAARLWRAASVLLTFHAVSVGWCFFRVPDLRAALDVLGQWFAFSPDRTWVGGAADPSLWTLLALYGGGMWLIRVGWPRVRRTSSPVRSWEAGFGWGLSAAMLLLSALLAPGDQAQPFIYFQF